MLTKVVEDNKNTTDFIGAINDIANFGAAKQAESKTAEIKLNRNYKALINNFNISKKQQNHVQEIYDFCKASKTKLKLDDFFKEAHMNNFAYESVDAKVSTLIQYISYYWQSVDFIDNLTDDERVVVLQKSGKILSTLLEAIELDGVFYKSYCHLANVKYDVESITHLRDLKNFLIYVIAVFISQMYFIIEQYAFLAAHAYESEKNSIKYREYLQKATLIFKQIKSQLVGKANFIDMLINRTCFNDNKLLHWKKTMKEIIYVEGEGEDIKTARLTALHVAAFQADAEFISAKFAVDDYYESNHIDAEGFTPLHCAVFGGVAVLELFLAHKNVDINAQSKAGLTALQLATINNNFEMVQILLKNPKIDVNKASDDGWTALHIAVSMQHVEIVVELLKVKTLEVNAKMFDQIYALHITAKLNDVNPMKMLLESGAKINETTGNGLTALQIAKKFRCFDALKTLQDFTKKIPTCNGNTSQNTVISSTETPTNVAANTTTIIAITSTNATSNTNDDLKLKTVVHEEKMGPVIALLQQFSSVDSETSTQLSKAVLKGIQLLVAQGGSAHKCSKISMDFAIVNDNLEIFKYFLAAQKRANQQLESLLFQAAKTGAFVILRYLLEEKALSPKTINEKGKTLLCTAIEGRNFQMLDYLIDEQCVSITQPSQYHPLCCAVEMDDIKMVEYFLEKGSNINGLCDHQRPILSAAKKASLKMFLYLIEKGASLRVRSNDECVIDFAVIGGNSEILEWLAKGKCLTIDSNFIEIVRLAKLQDIQSFMNDGRLNVQAKNPMGGTILHEAVFNKNLNVVRYFVETHGFDIKARDAIGFIPMFYAAKINNLDVVKYFVSERKLGIYLRNVRGETVLHVATINSCLNVVRYLVEEQQANINLKDDEGFTPIFSSTKYFVYDPVFEYLYNQHCIQGDIDVVKLLFQTKRIDLNKRDAAGQTPIFYAALAGQLDVVKYIYTEKANILIKNNKKQNVLSAVSSKFLTAQAVRENFDLIAYLLSAFERETLGLTWLHIAAELCNLEINKILIYWKAFDVNAVDHHGRTPLFCAASAGKLDVVEYFVDFANADIKIQDEYDQTALFTAVIFNQLEVVKFLVERGAGVEALNSYGESLISYAKGEVHKYLVNYLLEEAYLREIEKMH